MIYARDLIKLCNAKILNGNIDTVLDNFCINTKNLKTNDVFVALIGEKNNGNDYYIDAINKGAKAVIISEDKKNYKDACVILVEDTLLCLQKLAEYKRSLLNIPVIAVTGSVGKTSTKDLIYSVVSTKYNTLKTEGNFNNHIGVPLTILSYKNEDVMIVEMGMNHLNEIKLLSNITKPTISVITNIGTAHIGNLGSRDNILKAKLEILDGMIDNKLVLNIDNDMLYKAYNDLKDKYNITTISIDNNSNYKATNLNLDTFNSKYNINNNEININVGGIGFIYNSLIAYGVGKLLSINDELIIKGINNFKLSPHRLEKINGINNSTIIDDTYNANYDSMKSSIELLKNINNKRKICILGSMLELGKYSNLIHEKISDIIINSNIDILFLIGKETKIIKDKCIKLGMNKNNIYYYDNVNEIDYNLFNNLNKEDIILIKGSHSINLIEVVNKIKAD